MVFLLAFAANSQISQVNFLPGFSTTNSSGLIYQASGNDYASFPGGLAFDIDLAGSTVRKIIPQWNLNADGSTVVPRRVQVTNLFDGLHLGAIESSSNALTFNGFKRRDGTIISPEFSSGDHAFNYYTSTNNGVTWVLHTNGTTTISFDFGRGFIEENDGTLYCIGYGGANIWILKSTNGGVAWSQINGTPVANGGTDHRNYSEPTLARCVDGSWLVVMRVQTTNSPSTYLPMRYCRSTDDGVSWSAAALVPGLTTSLAVDPQLNLLPDGIMVLSWGYPDLSDNVGSPGRSCHIAFSTDGNGDSWTSDITTFTNQAGVLKGESTGYTYTAVLGPNRVVQIGDTGVNWSYSTTHPSPNPFTIWGRCGDIVPDNINRIDLKTKYALGVITVTPTNLAYSNATHPEARLSGMFDGSADYWSGAFGSGTNASLDIALDKVYRITALGICLHYNNAETANIYFSQDGVHWGVPVKAYVNAVHNAINYTKFPAPISAKYVGVDISGSGPLVCLNEIELYETSDTFENNAVEVTSDPHGTVPPGYTSAGTSGTQYGFAVRDGTNYSYQSSRGLQMWDGSSTWSAGIKKIIDPTKSKYWSFWIKPNAYAASNAAIGFTLKGQVTTGSDSVYATSIFSDGSIRYFNGSTWNNLSSPGAGSGTVPISTWSHIEVQATVSPTNAAIFVNGVFKGNAGMGVSPANVQYLNGFQFNSGGMTPSGDSAMFDDVNMTEFTSLLHTYESDTVGSAPAGYDAGSLMALVSTNQAHGGTKSLRIDDTATNAVAKISKTNNDTSDIKTLEFYAYPAALPGGFLFDILGTVTSGPTAICHLAVFPDGSVNYYNGSAWVQMTGGTTGLVPLNAWTKIRLEATKNGGNVYINDNWIGIAGTYANPANVLKLNGFAFSSSGTLPTGDDVYVDDVYFGP